MILDTEKLFAAAHAHWQAKVADAACGLPRPSDLKPEEMAAWMPDTLLVELDRQNFDFRFALVGTRIVAFYGAEFTGRTLTQLPFALDTSNEATFWRWWHVAKSPRAVRTTATHFLAPDRPIVLDRLIMPYAGREARTSRLMVVQTARLDSFGGWPAHMRPAGQRHIDRRVRPRPALRNPWAA